MSGQLALLGGRPIVASKHRWSWPPRDKAMAEVVRSYIADGQPLSIQGRDGILLDCEMELARRFHRKHAILCSSGTMALYSAYFALDVRPGDEVICTTITYHATATPALHLGAHVVLVDVEPDTGNISVDAVAAAITPRTVAVASNAMWGHPVDQARLRQLCDARGIAWVEDVSHAHFATFEQRPVGSFGDIACASLQGEKLISGGEGGVLLTDADAWHDRAVLLGHNLRRSEQTVIDSRYRPIGRTGYGLKLRCHPLSALLIHHQLVNHADRWVRERTDSLTRLSSALSQHEGLLPPVIRPYVTSMGAWYGYKPRVDTASLGVTRKTLVQALAAENVDVSEPGSPPLHRLPLFDVDRFPIGSFSKHDNRVSRFSNADAYSDSILSLPTFTGDRDEAARQDMVRAFDKVWTQLSDLRDWEWREQRGRGKAAV